MLSFRLMMSEPHALPCHHGTQALILLMDHLVPLPPHLGPPFWGWSGPLGPWPLLELATEPVGMRPV